MGIMESIDIGAKALQVHGRRIDIHAKNIANLDTPNYVRKIPVLNAVDDVSFQGVMNSMKEDVSVLVHLRIYRVELLFQVLLKTLHLGKRFTNRDTLMPMRTVI